MNRILSLWTLLSLWNTSHVLPSCQAFTTKRIRRSSFVGSPLSSSAGKCVGSSGAASTLVMRDLSASYWFSVGDSVKVVDDVMKANKNLRGLIGTVAETWEKCDVDPTCCCAEQVDTGMAIRVQFKTEEEEFLHYFAEEELLKVAASTNNTTSQMLPFDGMSCAAFKLEQLQTDKPRGIAHYEPKRFEDLGGKSSM